MVVIWAHIQQGVINVGGSLALLNKEPIGPRDGPQV